MEANFSGVKNFESNLKLHMEFLDKNDELHRVYPDFVIVNENKLIVIEFDENQHKAVGYDEEYQQLRTNAIHDEAEKNGKKSLVMRFNPDAYIAKDETRFKSCFKVCQETKRDVIRDDQEWQVRVNHFLAELEFYLRCDSEKLPLYALYYFFDGFDHSVLSGVSSSSRKRSLQEFQSNGGIA